MRCVFITDDGAKGGACFLGAGATFLRMSLGGPCFRAVTFNIVFAVLGSLSVRISYGVGGDMFSARCAAELMSVKDWSLILREANAAHDLGNNSTAKFLIITLGMQRPLVRYRSSAHVGSIRPRKIHLSSFVFRE